MSPPSGSCCAWELKVDGYWKQSIPCRRELLLPPLIEISHGDLLLGSWVMEWTVLQGGLG